MVDTNQSGMNPHNIVKPKNQPPHPLAGKVKLAGYSALAHRLGVPRSTAIRLCDRGEVRVFSQGPSELVVSEKDIAQTALSVALKAEADWNRAQDRARVANTLANPDAATDNDLAYSLARVSGKQYAELWWHFSNRKRNGRPFVQEKYESELAAVESAKQTFPRRVKRFNAATGMTEEHLAAPLPQGKPLPE